MVVIGTCNLHVQILLSKYSLLIVQNGQYAVHPNFTCRLVHFLFCRGRYNFFLANCCDRFIDVNVSQTHSVIFFPSFY